MIRIQWDNARHRGLYRTSASLVELWVVDVRQIEDNLGYYKPPRGYQWRIDCHGRRWDDGFEYGIRDAKEAAESRLLSLIKDIDKFGRQQLSSL